MKSRNSLPKTIFNLFFIILFVAISANLQAQSDKVRIKLSQPPPNKLGVGDMWNLELNNTTGKDIKIYLTGTATEEKDGLIIEGKSKVFTVKPGRSNHKYNDFTGAEIKYNNGKYKEIILRTGNAPEGSYTLCVTAFEESGEMAGIENCIMQNVEQMGTITLISPEDNIELDPDTIGSIMFSWTPLPKGGPYSLRIVELKGDQSPEVAMKQNRTILEVNDIKTTSHHVAPSQTKVIVMGMKYAWQVSSGDVVSEPYVIYIPMSSPEISLISPSNGKEIDPDSLSGLVFSWNECPKCPPMYTLRIVEIKGSQSLEEAFRSNQPILEKDYKSTTTNGDPVHGVDVKPGMKYAWQVSSGDFQSEAFVYSVYSQQKSTRLIDITLISPAPGTEVNNEKPIEFEFEISGDVTEEDQFEVIIAELSEKDDPGSTKATLVIPHIIESSGPISSPKKGKHKWWGMSANNSGYEPGKRYVWTVRSTGEPVHGVDIKLGLKNMQGEPVHGFDVKIGIKKSEGMDLNNPKNIDHQVWEYFGTKVNCERLGVTFQAAKKIGVNQYRLFAEFTNIIYYQTTDFVNNHPLPEPNIISYEQLFPPVSDPRLFCDEDGLTISRLNGIWKVTEQNTRIGGYVDLGSIPPVNFTLFTLVNLWNNNFPDNLGSSCRCRLAVGWTSGWEGGSPWIDSLIDAEENRPPDVDTASTQADSSSGSHWHPDIVIYNSGKIIALSGKDKQQNVRVYMNEARLLQLAGEQLTNLKISKDEFLKKLNTYLLTGDSQHFVAYAYQPGIPQYGDNDGCKTVYCNNPNHPPGCGWKECSK